MISMAAERRAMYARYEDAYRRQGLPEGWAFARGKKRFAITIWAFARGRESFALANAGICAAVPGRQGKSKAWLAQWKEAHRRVIARIGELGRKAR